MLAKIKLCYYPCWDSFPKSQSVPTICISISKLYTIRYYSNSNNRGALLSFTSQQYLKSLYVCLFTIYKEGEGSIREPAYPCYFLTKSLTIKSLKHSDISYSSYEVITGALAYLLARSCNRCDMSCTLQKLGAIS